jgi:hypothetical protein
MITIDQILDEWDADAPIRYDNLGEEATKTAILHAKYLRYLQTAKQQFRKERKRADKIIALRTRYYNGELSKEELEEYEWEPYLFVRPIKDNLIKLLDTDKFVSGQMDQVIYYQNLMDALVEIIKKINTRTWDVKTAVEYYKFTSGGL